MSVGWEALFIFFLPNTSWLACIFFHVEFLILPSKSPCGFLKKLQEEITVEVSLVHISCPRKLEDEEITYLYFVKWTHRGKKNKTMCGLSNVIFNFREVLTCSWINIMRKCDCAESGERRGLGKFSVRGSEGRALLPRQRWLSSSTLAVWQSRIGREAHKTLLLIVLLSVRQAPDVVGRGEFQGVKGKAGNLTRIYTAVWSPAVVRLDWNSNTDTYPLCSLESGILLFQTSISTARK